MSDGIRIHSVRLPGLIAHQEVILGQPVKFTLCHDTSDRLLYARSATCNRKVPSSNPSLWFREDIVRSTPTPNTHVSPTHARNLNNSSSHCHRCSVPLLLGKVLVFESAVNFCGIRGGCWLWHLLAKGSRRCFFRGTGRGLYWLGSSLVG